MKARNINTQAGRGSSSQKAEVKGIKKTGRTVEHKVEVGDTIEKVQATCKIFGGCFIDNGYQLDGDCKNCKESQFVQDMCRIASHPQVLDFGAKKQKTTKVNGKDFVKKWANGEGRGGMKVFIQNLVEAGKYSKKEVLEKIRIAYPDSAKTVPSLYISHGMKGKGKDAKRFPWKIVEQNGKLVFDKKCPAGSWGQA